MREREDETIGHGEGAIDVNVDYGKADGLWVRLDVYLPAKQLYNGRRSGNHDAWVGLTVEEAETLITALREAVDHISYERRRQ